MFLVKCVGFHGILILLRPNLHHQPFAPTSTLLHLLLLCFLWFTSSSTSSSSTSSSSSSRSSASAFASSTLAICGFLLLVLYCLVYYCVSRNASFCLSTCCTSVQAYFWFSFFVSTCLSVSSGFKLNFVIIVPLFDLRCLSACRRCFVRVRSTSCEQWAQSESPSSYHRYVIHSSCIHWGNINQPSIESTMDVSCVIAWVWIDYLTIITVPSSLVIDAWCDVMVTSLICKNALWPLCVPTWYHRRFLTPFTFYT